MPAHAGGAQVGIARVLLVRVFTQPQAGEMIPVIHWYLFCWIQLGVGADEAVFIPGGAAGYAASVCVGVVAGGGNVGLVATTAGIRGTSVGVTRAAVTGAT